jgi:hypothetical protein
MRFDFHIHLVVPAIPYFNPSFRTQWPAFPLTLDPQLKAHPKRFHDSDGQTFVWQIRIHLDTPIASNAAYYHILKLPFYPIALGPTGFTIHGYAPQQLRVRHIRTVGSQANMKRLVSCLFSARLQIAGQLCNKWPVKQTWSKQFGQARKPREFEVAISTLSLTLNIASAILATWAISATS